MKLRCLCCKKEHEFDEHHLVYDALIFTASGNFGSRIHDLADAELIAVVCDQCVKERVGDIVGRRIQRSQETHTFHDAREIIGSDEGSSEGTP